MTNTYERYGAYPVVEEADLLNLVSAANRQGDTRVGGDSAGKRKGKEILVRLTSDDTLKRVFALGELSSDAWSVVDGSANIVPVNLNPAAAGWTIGGDSTYAANLLTTDGGNDAAGRAYQTVALKAGTYRVQGVMACEGDNGESPDFEAPRLRVTTGAVTAGVGATLVTTKIGQPTYIHATAAESADPKEDVSFSFTIAADSNVTFVLDVVDEADALVAGSAYVELEVLEAE